MEADVLARLLGLKLLRLRADIVLTPAQVHRVSPSPDSTPGRRPPVDTTPASGNGQLPGGQALAEAARLVRESRRMLEARH